ncbi:MAG: formate--tetrahydrofolate ligase [Thermoplasmata archaeon]
MREIEEIISEIGLGKNDYELYGKYMAKVSLDLQNSGKKKAKLILVTAMTPTAAGEGKTTTTIGLSQAFKKLGKNVAIAIREPSLGPCFGIKGGATGGGKSKVEPSDRINLLFTGDFPAVTAAHNLLSAMINNHIYHGNELNIDPKRITFPRTIDMNDRSLRNIIVGVGPRETGAIANDSFVITPASEIMAILGLSLNYSDLKKRLSKIVIGFTTKNKPVTAGDLKAEGSMAALLRDALKPNLVQTTDGVPAFIHTGPFGNIAHGTSSIVADKIAMNYFDYVITEAGFGSDLGAEKFFDMVSRIGNLPIDAVVIVATIRALKLHGESKKEGEDVAAVERGVKNLLHHVRNIRNYGIEPVVAVNRFPDDTQAEIKRLGEVLDADGVKWALSEVFAKGAEGGVDLANKVLQSIGTHEIKRVYDVNDDIRTKIEKIATKIYGADSVVFEKKALLDIKKATEIMGNPYVCMAKTQYSFSDDAKLINDPKGFKITVQSVNISAGAGFVVPILGEIMTMPGLPKKPAAEDVDLTDDGEITGLF